MEWCGRAREIYDEQRMMLTHPAALVATVNRTILYGPLPFAAPLIISQVIALPTIGVCVPASLDKLPPHHILNWGQVKKLHLRK